MFEEFDENLGFSSMRTWRTRARNILEWIWTTLHGPSSSISTTDPLPVAQITLAAITPNVRNGSQAGHFRRATRDIVDRGDEIRIVLGPPRANSIISAWWHDAGSAPICADPTCRQDAELSVARERTEELWIFVWNGLELIGIRKRFPMIRNIRPSL